MSHPTPAGKTQWLGLATLIIPTLIASMDLTVLFYALPFINADLRPTTTAQLWMIDIYGFVLAGLLITMGALADRVGRRRLLMIGAGLFAAASLLVALSHTAPLFILARALQGLGGATLMPCALGLVRALFKDEKQRSMAVGIWSMGGAAGTLLGPIIGGALLNHFHWNAVFLINIPIMLLLIIILPRLTPEVRAPGRARLDVPSALLSLAAILLVISSIKAFAISGFSLQAGAELIAGLTLAALFMRRQRTHPDPLLDLKLFTPRFSATLLIGLLAATALIGFSVYGTQYMQLVLGLRPLNAALITLPLSLVAMGGAPSAMALAGRIGAGKVISLGFAVAALGYAEMMFVPATHGLWWLLIGSALTALGSVTVLTLVTDQVLAAAPSERAGTATALSETGHELGGALGIALLGSVGAAIYSRDVLTHTRVGLSAQLAKQASQTLGDAQAIATHLPAALQGALMHSARAAFTHGLHVAALCTALLMLAAAAFSLLRLTKQAPKAAAPAVASD